jgi:SAM-dependent methyltransferase
LSISDTKDRRGFDIAAGYQNVLATKVFPSHADKDFFSRVYTTPQEVYLNRLRAIGFCDFAKVLDAGCGYGQWTVALSSLNASVDACDISEFRLEVVQSIAAASGIHNITVRPASIDKLPYDNHRFDAVFCYGAVFFVDYWQAFHEFYRVLKPGGKLYFTANGPGWYLYSLIQNHKPSKDFSSRRMALDTFLNTGRFCVTGSFRTGAQIVMPIGAARRALEQVGFSNIQVNGDGKIAVQPGLNTRSFFPKTKFGLPNVYEVLCTK